MAKIADHMRSRLSIHLQGVAREIQSDLQEREAFGIQDTPPISPMAPTIPENTMTPAEKKTLFFVFKEAMIGLVACIKACNKKTTEQAQMAAEDQLKEPAPVRAPTPYPADSGVMPEKVKQPESGSPFPLPKP